MVRTRQQNLKLNAMNSSDGIEKMKDHEKELDIHKLVLPNGISHDDIKFGRFNCRIILTKAVILNCIAHSSDKSEKLECKVIRDETRVNTFNVRVKRTDQNMDDRADDNACNSPKRFKVSADQPTKVALAGTTKPKSKEGKKGKKGKSSRAIVLRKPGPKSLEFVEVNQVLLCKMRGYPEWPCMVTDIENKFIHITFFGDKTTHKTTIGHLFDFKLNHLTVRKHLRRLTTPLYRKSVLEAELSLGVPKEHSILNEI